MKIKNKTKWLCYTALMTAITAVATMVVQIPSIDGGYTNLSDAIIFMTAILMDPVAAMIAGGIGTFLADLIVYPTTMFFSLAFHGVEGLVVGLLIWLIPRGHGKAQYFLDIAYMLIGGAIMIVGYYFAKRFVYGTAASALISLWRNCIQVGVSIVVAYLLIYPLKLERIVDRSSLYEPRKASAVTVTSATVDATPPNESINSDVNMGDKVYTSPTQSSANDLSDAAQTTENAATISEQSPETSNTEQPENVAPRAEQLSETPTSNTEQPENVAPNTESPEKQHTSQG